MSLLQKILEVNKRVTTVDKGGTNTFSRYDYSRLGDILAPLRPVLQDLSLVVYQSVQPIENSLEVIDGSYYSVSKCTCITTVVDVESGDNIQVQSVGFSIDKQGDKAAYKATTGARKYGITMVFNLDWDAVEPEDPALDDKRFKTTKSTPGTNTNTEVKRTFKRF